MNIKALKPSLQSEWAVRLAIATGPVLLIGKPLIFGQVLFWGTPALQFVPWWMEGIRQITHGTVPLWNGFNGMGAPLLANYQSAFFYPPNLVILLSGIWYGVEGVARGFTFMSMVHLIWGGWGAAALIRRLGGSRMAQVVGGMAFAMGGYLIGRLGFISMIWAAVWLPWIILFTDEIVSPATTSPTKEEKVQWFHFPLVVCISLQLLAGHAQLSWYTLQLATIWLLAGIWQKRSNRKVWKGILTFTGSVMCAALIAAIQLIPTAEYLLQSQRASQVGFEEAMTYSFWPWRLITLASPFFFGNPGTGTYWGYASFWEDHAYLGVLPLILACSTLKEVFRNRSHSPVHGFLNPFVLRLLWGINLVALIFALGKNTPVFVFFYRYVPTFNMFQAPARYLIWLAFSMTLLAAHGVDSWKKPSGRGLYWLRLSGAGAFAITLGAGITAFLLPNVKATFIQSMAMTGFWALGVVVLTLFANRRGERWWQGAVFLWVLSDLFLAGQTVVPVVDATFYSQMTSNSQWIRESLNGKRIYLHSQDEYHLKFDRFFRMADYREKNGDTWLSMREVLLPNLNLLEEIASVNNFDPLVPGRYKEWIDMLEKGPLHQQERMLSRMNVGLIEVPESKAAGGIRLMRTDTGSGVTWFSCAVGASTEEEALQKMVLNDFSNQMLVVEGIGAQGKDCDQTQVKEFSIEGNAGKWRVYLSTEQDGWIRVSQVWYPGWTAKIDQTKAVIYRGDYLFMAIFVPAGDHTIWLEYQPWSFRIGLILSILMIITFGIFVIRRQRSKWAAIGTG
ncbi:bacterial membrane protein YfhO [Anaerolinea thermolimosa]|uniref:YfhO family protein n=1 Tax=Anaerolinea thermolimosa TaxID=229919 RepID=UPI0007840F77|nr:YfhO family protein [Anaerolinea thermolimosa]GAP06648.1 bacterial membrane protein YfhO [Anaerolinea thermolimosa]